MRDQRKIKQLKLIGVLLFIILAVIIGLTLFYRPGSRTKAPAAASHSTQKSSSSSSSVAAPPLLTQDLVARFLSAYYTWDSVGSNQAAYRPYMTDSFYQTTIKSLETKQAQTYKGLVINQQLTASKIYLDTITNEAVCELTYTNENLQHPVTSSSPNPKKATMTNHVTVLVTYSSTGKNLLVNGLKVYYGGVNGN